MLIAPLSAGEFASLREIGAGMILGAEPIPFAHLGTLLRLGYVSAVAASYEATPAGVFRIASGS